MKLKRLSSLVGLLAALLIFTGGRALAVDAIAVADAYAFPGGSDTVDVIITSVAAYPGAEITLSYNKTALSTTEAQVIVNEAAWNPSWGTPEVVVDTAAGTVKVGVVSLTDVTARIPQSSSALKLFSVIFNVAATASTGSYTITPSGKFVSVDANYNFTELPIGTVTSGSMIVQSLYNMSVDSVNTGLGVLTPVAVNLVNGREVVSVEFTLAYDKTQVVYGDSIVINDLYDGGDVAFEVTNSGDSLKVAIYTVSAATIPVSNSSRWLARVYMKSATGATVKASNPLTLTTSAKVVTRDEQYNLVENTPNLVPGNINIQSPYALRIGDAAAPQGGMGAVNVYLRSSETIVGVQATMLFDKNKYTVSESNVDLNEAIFASGSANLVSISTTDSSVLVLASAAATDSIAASSSERTLFTVTLGVKATATAGYDSINGLATLTTRDANYNTTEVPVTSITKGAFRVQAPYELTVKNRAAVPEAQNIPVTIQITNQADIYSAEIVVKYNTAELEYVAGSVEILDGIWTGAKPTPEIVAAGDSIKIGLLDFNDVNNKIAGGSANQELLTIGFNVKPALTVGSSATLTPHGLLVGRDEAYQSVEYAPAGVAGTVSIASDIIPPNAVSNATFMVSGTTVSLSWKNPNDTDLDYVKITRTNSSNETVTVVTRDTPVPGATDSFDDLNVAAGSYTYSFIVADLAGNVGNVVTLNVTNGEQPPVTAIMVRSGIARVGGKVTPKIAITNPDNNIAGASFKVTFDTTKLTLMDITPGPDAAGLAPVSAPDIAAANASGEIMLDMIDLSGSNPVLASNEIKRISVLEFMVDSAAAAGDVVALTLSDVSLSDPDGMDVTPVVTSGTVTVQNQADTDLNDDGMTNIADIWYYINMDEMVQFESLAELIANLLARPLPTSLAAVQDATATADYRADGNAAQINFAVDYEIVAARFTFSYDRTYQLEGVGLNPALADKMMIKKYISDGRLYVDVIALGGFVPSEVGEIFSVAFRDTDHQTAGLNLEQIETADRDGIVRIEAAKVNRIALPKAYSLSQNSPNPFNPSTTIKYQVPEGNAARVQIVVYNLRGQKVITLVDELKESGDYSVNWSGQNSSGQRVSSGVYFYRMSAGEFSAMRKMVIVK